MLAGFLVTSCVSAARSKVLGWSGLGLGAGQGYRIGVYEKGECEGWGK